jgi:opacity protein-like surface antigen
LGIPSRIELEAAHRANRIHGRNGPGCNSGDCSADDLADNVLNATSMMLNAWPELRWGDTSLYAGGGVGGAYVTGLDDENLTPVAQIGAGITWRFSDAFDADLGYRYFTTTPLEA